MRAMSRLEIKVNEAISKVESAFSHRFNGKKQYDFRICKPGKQLSVVFLCVLSLNS